MKNKRANTTVSSDEQASIHQALQTAVQVNQRGEALPLELRKRLAAFGRKKRKTPNRS